jgi:DNA processing protein
MEDNIYYIWITSKKYIGAIKIKKLLEYFKNIKGIYNSNEKQLRDIKGLSNFDIESLMDKDTNEAEKILYNVTRINAEIITINNNRYPRLLKHIYNPPIVIYVRGNMKLNSTFGISVVGSRKATDYGKKVAYCISKELSSKGFTVVSGMAKGIDAYAHLGSLDGGSGTAAVLGCGVDVVYPFENKKLMEKIIEKGVLVSEYPPGTKPKASYFPVRNRIISGMCFGTLVVEAEIKSGSLITSNFALEQGREVFAVPGNINSSLSEGCNDLIKQGAKLVMSADDIIEEIKEEI